MNKRKLTVEEIGHIVGDANFAAHQQEAEEAYGSSEDWAVYQQRTAGWSEKNWSDAQAGVAEVEKELAEAVASGKTPDSEEAQGIVGRDKVLLHEHPFELDRRVAVDAARELAGRRRVEAGPGAPASAKVSDFGDPTAAEIGEDGVDLRLDRGHTSPQHSAFWYPPTTRGDSYWRFPSQQGFRHYQTQNSKA
mgnify:CR=1 FL=1